MLDYEMSNLRSAEKALERLGGSVAHARKPAEAGEFDALVLPGDGHFGEAICARCGVRARTAWSDISTTLMRRR